ncbi:MAG: hypothetical protein E6J90_02130 [Deltaproteobacteria bacterium]|nr:MAG: hypothetical protein E6J91_07955 [Deltaproteobacteria bacterium]TMQ27657.1 MAG: hypothetical protein E6J90_02130 [Deltaproteobacteria bacterium]
MKAEGKALFLRNLPTELVREAKAAAARRGETLTKFVAEALARSLGAAGERAAPANDLQDDMMWYRKHRPSLLRRYRGEYVAIVDASVVDHDRDFAALALRVFSRFGNRNIFMPRVASDDPVVRLRSPRISRR